MKTYKFLLFSLFFSLNLMEKCEENNSDTKAIPFVLTDHNNISITTLINEKDTLNLMLHTGAESVSLIQEALKKTKTINWEESEKVESWGGQNIARSSSNNTLDIGGFIRDSITIWDCKNSGPLTDGKFGLDIFQEKTVEIDFDKKTVTLHNTLPKKVDDFNKLELINEKGLLFLEAESIIGDRSFKNRYLIHSGYKGTILYDDDFVASSKIGNKIEIIDKKELKDSFGNIIKVKKGKLPLFKIGNKELKEIPVGFFEGSIGRQKMSVLGGDILKRFNIIIDSERKYIYLKQNKLTNSSYS